MHLGAALADPSRFDDLAPRLSAYGLPLGDAFQMRDDVMGAFGDEAVTGKPVGGDLREGKPTPLLARAIAASTPAQRAILDEVGSPNLDDDDIANMQQVIVDSGALAALETQIATLTDEAIAAIEAAPITQESRRELIELANYVSWRAV
jgi:geranylgeranyl diphosphate synthase type I